MPLDPAATHRLRRSLLLLAAGALTGACVAPTDDADEPDTSADAVQAALPIRGEWALVRWQGQVTTTAGSTWEHHPIDHRYDARAREGLATFDLDSNGEGTLRATGRCRSEIPEARGRPAGGAPRGATLVGGTYALVSAVLNVVQTLRCSADQPVERTIRVWPRRNLFGQPSPGLLANVGVYGEGSSARAAEAECRAMRGVRWITFDGGAVACIGYADGEARTLEMLLQRPGEIYVQRIVMRRPGDP